MNENLFNSGFDGETFVLKGSTTGIILFHGFTATTLEVRALAETIHTHTGWTVYAPLLPGHGTSPEDLARVSYTDWINFSDTSFEYLKTMSNEWYSGGESMGGLLTLVLAARHPEIKRLAVFAPALKIPGLFKAQLFRHFIFSSPKKRLGATREGCLPWQGYRVNPLKAVVELGKLQKLTLQLLPAITQPVLLFQGKEDQTIDPRSAAMVYNAVSSKQKRIVELEDCGHTVLLDKQHADVNRMTVEFLTEDWRQFAFD